MTGMVSAIRALGTFALVLLLVAGTVLPVAALDNPQPERQAFDDPAGATNTYTITSDGSGQASAPPTFLVVKTEDIPEPVRVPNQVGETTQIFNPDAGYDLFTFYGRSTEVDLTDYLADGAGEIIFSIGSCDGSSGDYYDSVTVDNGTMTPVGNTEGHVHGPNTQTNTVCTVTGSNGTVSQDQEFRMYTVSDRVPQPLPSGALSLVATRPTELDVRINLPGSSLGYVRIGWRKTGEPPSFAVASGVTDGTVLTFQGLESAADYEVRAFLMTA